MFTLIINHQADTLIMELPCGRMQMAEHLASIGVVNPAHEIKCISEDDDPIEVKIYGNSEFEKKLAAFISPSTTLSVFNSFCEMYQNIPYEDKLKVQESVLNGSVDSLSGFGKLILEGNLRDTVSFYYCPLIATVYSRNEYGDLEDYPDEYDGSYLTPYMDYRKHGQFEFTAPAILFATLVFALTAPPVYLVDHRYVNEQSQNNRELCEQNHIILKISCMIVDFHLVWVYNNIKARGGRSYETTHTG